MNVSIDFPEEIEAHLRRRAAETGQDVESYIRWGVTEDVVSGLPSSGDIPPRDDFSRRLRETIQRHGLASRLTFNQADFARFTRISAFTPAEIVADRIPS